MFIFCFMESLILLTGMSVTLGCKIVQVARSAILLDISLPVLTIYDGTHINLMFFFFFDTFSLI